MSSKKRSRSPSKHSSSERSNKRHKHTHRRSDDNGDNASGRDNTSGNPAAFDELLKQMASISEAVANLGQRLANLEETNASKGSDQDNNNNNSSNNGHAAVVTPDDFSPNANEINSMDQLSVMVSPDQEIDSVAPETLENDSGHGDGPPVSESLKNKAAKLSEHAEENQLFEPVEQAPNWIPSDSLKSFLELNFRRSLSSSQIFSILEDTSLPNVDVLTTPKLDKTIVDQVPFNYKKSVEFRDKELLKVQRHVLNVAAPLTTLHDILENKQTVSVADTLGILEKALCLLGNASNALSILRRYKVLYAINPKKCSLAEAPYPNAGKQLFGSDISKVASESADITRNLQKNLSQSHPFPGNRFQYDKYQAKNDKFRQNTFGQQRFFQQGKKRPFQTQPFRQQSFRQQPFRQTQPLSNKSH